MSIRLSLLGCLSVLLPALAAATPPVKWTGRNARGTYRGTVESSSTLFRTATPGTEIAIYKVERRGDRVTLWTQRPQAGKPAVTSKTVGRVIETSYFAPYDTTVLHVVFDDPRNLRHARRLDARVLAPIGYKLGLRESTGTAILAFHRDGKLVVTAEEKVKLGSLRPTTLGAALTWPLMELAKRLDLNHTVTTTSSFEGTPAR